MGTPAWPGGVQPGGGTKALFESAGLAAMATGAVSGAATLADGGEPRDSEAELAWISGALDPPDTVTG